MTGTHTSQQTPKPVFASYEDFLEASARLTLPRGTATDVVSHKLAGENYSIRYFVEPSAEGEKLTWAVIHASPAGREDGTMLTLWPFPQGSAAEKLHALLKDAKAAGTKAEEVFPALEALGKEANGVGWIPSVPHPLGGFRQDLPPSTYLAPSLEMILNNDPSIGNLYVSSRNNNGTYDVCLAHINQAEAKIEIGFFRSENGETPKLARMLDLPIPSVMRAELEKNPELLRTNLLSLANEFQNHFYSAGMNFAISRIERFAVKFNRESDLPPNATRDDRLRLLTSIHPPYEFSHRFSSGAIMAVEAGEDVLAVLIKGPHLSASSAYIAILDRAKLKRSDTEWPAIREEFMNTTRLLANESEGLQAQAIENIVALTTQQVRLPAEIKHVVGPEASAALSQLAQHYGLVLRTELGQGASQIRRLCDGTEVIAISRPTKRLGTEDLTLFNHLALEFKQNGDLEYSAQNLSGNQIAGRVSAAGIAAVGGRPQMALYLAQTFCQQMEGGNRTPFETGVATVTNIDAEGSYYVLDGQSPYLDLPAFTDGEGRSAFFFAGMLALRMCETSRGHGRHRAGAVGPGMAEAQLQFPGAPYDLFVRVNGNTITQADFIPKPSETGTELPRYSFAGEVGLQTTDLDELAGLLDSFSEWAVKHSQKTPGVGPLEDTMAFKALGRLLTQVS